MELDGSEIRSASDGWGGVSILATMAQSARMFERLAGRFEFAKPAANESARRISAAVRKPAQVVDSS